MRAVRLRRELPAHCLILIPEVSIIIPTRNRATLLPRAVDSVLCQTFPAWELIIVDDGSQDDTATVCKDYRNDSRIRYQRTTQCGVSAARNIGMVLARADWLAFLDSDDLWMPAKLERQLARLNFTGDKICHTDEVWIRRGRRVNPGKKHKKPEGWIFRECLPLCVMSPSSVIAHRSIFEKVGGFDEWYAVCEDYELWLRVSASYRVSLIAEKLVTKFGGHDDQLSRQFWGMDRWRAHALYSRLLDASLRWDWRHAAFDELIRKLAVLIQGYSRRQRSVPLRQLIDFSDQVRSWWKCAVANRDLPEIPPQLPPVLACPVERATYPFL